MSRSVHAPTVLCALAFCMCVLCGTALNPMRAFAQEPVPISGVVQVLPNDDRYEWWSAYDRHESTLGSNSLAALSIEGDVNEGKITDGVQGYVVISGDVDLAIATDRSAFMGDDSEWELVADTATTVGGVDLGGKVGTGAIVLQSSIDRTYWSDEVVRTDVFADGTTPDGILYTTKPIQLQNGCYYRLNVAYELRRHAEDSQILFYTKTDNYEHVNVVETYEFYAVTIDLAQRTRPSDVPRRELGTNARVNTGLDNGYSEAHAIDKDDPHYGWQIGQFFVNGYTRETSGDDGSPVFLKNLNDRVTLWFHLDQDIARLNNDEGLAIADDANGYDRRFEVAQTDFGRGTLIVRFTDHQGVAHEPVVYTDYLAANAKTGADTRVQLFEEGDYEVVLDYEVARAKKIGPVDAPEYFNYQISFSFSIRNGNCMVFPMDASTGGELAANAITPNGFKLDMARSRYLTIDVTRTAVSARGDGTLTEDVRFNRPAKDGETYTDPGVYTFKVKNLYTGETTTKTIYVGSDKNLTALSRTGMTVAALNEKIRDGYSVGEDGTLIAPGEAGPDDDAFAAVVDASDAD